MTKHVHCTSHGPKVKATGLSKCCEPRLHNDSRSNKNVNERMEERKIADESNDLGFCGGGAAKGREGTEKVAYFRDSSNVPLHGKREMVLFFATFTIRERKCVRRQQFSLLETPVDDSLHLLLKLLLFGCCCCCRRRRHWHHSPRLFDIPFCQCVCVCLSVCMRDLSDRFYIRSSSVARLSSTMDLSC